MGELQPGVLAQEVIELLGCGWLEMKGGDAEVIPEVAALWIGIGDEESGRGGECLAFLRGGLLPGWKQHEVELLAEGREAEGWESGQPALSKPVLKGNTCAHARQGSGVAAGLWRDGWCACPAHPGAVGLADRAPVRGCHPPLDPVGEQAGCGREVVISEGERCLSPGMQIAEAGRIFGVQTALVLVPPARLEQGGGAQPCGDPPGEEVLERRLACWQHQAPGHTGLEVVPRMEERMGLATFLPAVGAVVVERIAEIRQIGMDAPVKLRIKPACEQLFG